MRVVDAKEKFDIFLIENTLNLVDEENVIAKAGFHDYSNPVLNPNQPNNVYIDFETDSFEIKELDMLFKALIDRIKIFVEENNLSNVRVFNYSKDNTGNKVRFYKRNGLTKGQGLVILESELEDSKHISTNTIKEVKLDNDKSIYQVIDMYNKVFSEKKEIDWIEELKEHTGFKAYASYKGNSMAGIVLYYYTEENHKTYGFIDLLMMNEDSRELGLGKELLSFAHDKMRQDGIKFCRLELWEPNINAYKFYKKNGYYYLSEIGQAYDMVIDK